MGHPHEARSGERKTKMKITFHMLPSELLVAARGMTAGLRHQTEAHAEISQIEDEIRNQLMAYAPMSVQRPEGVTLDLEPRQWRVFKDVVLTSAFDAEGMGTQTIRVLSATAKTISVGLATEG